MAMRASVWRWATVLLVLAVAFLSYQQPGLLADFLSLRYCG